MLTEIELTKISLQPNETLVVQVKADSDEKYDEVGIQSFCDRLRQHLKSDKVIVIYGESTLHFTKITTEVQKLCDSCKPEKVYEGSNYYDGEA